MLELQIHLNQNLPGSLFAAMKRCIKKCGSLPEHYLFSACEKHLRDALEEVKINSVVQNSHDLTNETPFFLILNYI